MDGWGRVIAAVIDRRAELGWTQKQLAAKAGVSERTIQNLEGGKHPLPVIRGKIERALGWQPGEFRRIEAGDAIEPRDEHEQFILSMGKLTDYDKRQMIASHRRTKAAAEARSTPPATAGNTEPEQEQPPESAAS